MREYTVKYRQDGFTLLEMLLVLAISSSLLLLIVNFTTQKADQLRRDKTVLQTQQVLNAAIAYYINNSAWPLPSSSSCGGTTWMALSSTSLFPGYLPATFTANAYGQPYYINCSSGTSSTGSNFYVATSVNTRFADAMIIAGMLPMAFIDNTSPGPSSNPPTQSGTCTTPASGCTTVVSSVNIPGQNLNNARSINFAGLYYSGSCVPAPSCPAGMTASIITIPTSVMGIEASDSTVSCNNYYADPSKCSPKTFPINYFSAYARGDSSGLPTTPGTSGSGGPYSCWSSTGTSSQQACVYQDTSNSSAASYTLINSSSNSAEKNSKYWRVCLTVNNEQGAISISSSGGTQAYWRDMGQLMGKVAAFTRCVPNSGSEIPSGSNAVYQPST